MVKKGKKRAQFNKIIIMELIEECCQQENKGTNEGSNERTGKGTNE
jgi:hypothetical protein